MNNGRATKSRRTAIIPTDFKTPDAQPLESTVVVPPSVQTPPSTTVTPPTVQAKPAPRQPGRPYLNAVLLGIALSLVTILLMQLIPIWAKPTYSSYAYPTPLQAIPSVATSLIAGFILGRRKEARNAALLAGVIIAISECVFMIVASSTSYSSFPYITSDDWAQIWTLVVAVTIACGPLSWLAAWIRSLSQPSEQ